MTDKPETKTEKSPALKENLIRLVTVFAYVSSVSMAAMCLSSYYIFFWEPKPPGPGPPIIHPHAYVSDPYPPLKLVAPLPDDDSQGASFWQSVRSFFQPDETTTKPLETTRERAEQTTPQDMTPSTITPEVDNSTDPMGIEIPSMIILEANSNNHLDNKEVFDTVLEHEANMPMHQGYVGVIPNRAKRGNRHVKPSLAGTREDSNESDKVKTDMTEHTNTEQGTKNEITGTQNEQITEVTKDPKDKDHTSLLNERIETQATTNQSELKQSIENSKVANSDPTTKGPNEDGIRTTKPIGYVIAKRADSNATTNNAKDKAITTTKSLKENTTESTPTVVHELQDETTVTQSRYETVTQSRYQTFQSRDQTVTKSQEQTVTQSQNQTTPEDVQSTTYKLAKRDITTNDPTMNKDVSKAFTTFGNDKLAIKELKNQGGSADENKASNEKGITLNPEIELFSNIVLYTKAIDTMIKETPNEPEDKTLQKSTNKQTGEKAELMEGLARKVDGILANTELTTEGPNEDGVKTMKDEPTEGLIVGDAVSSTAMSPHTVLTHMEHPVNDPQNQHHLRQLRPRRRFPGVPGH